MEKSAEITRKDRKCSPKLVRRHILLRGVVQGVGFRPFVYGLARRHGLNGWVNNSSDGVHVEVEGEPGSVEQFTLEVSRSAPPRARIESIHFAGSGEGWVPGFRDSAERGGIRQVSARLPRYRHLSGLPDGDFRPGRPALPLSFHQLHQLRSAFYHHRGHPLRPAQNHDGQVRACARNAGGSTTIPLDRRFHAQPNACPICGPALQLCDRDGKRLAAEDPVSKAVGLLREGKIIAIKGLGGFLLACDAGNSAAVETLRGRKQRPDKPFAVMFADIPSVKEHCLIKPGRRRTSPLPGKPYCPFALERKLVDPTVRGPGTEVPGGDAPLHTPSSSVNARIGNARWS